MTKALSRLALASLAVATMVTLRPPAANADFITFQNGPGGASAQINNVTYLTGDAVAQNGTNIAVGSTFNIYYQANVGALLNSGTPQFAGQLNSSFFLTTVLGVTEQVTSLSTAVINGQTVVTATFGLAPVQTTNYVDVYYNTSGLGNNTTGTGFNNTGTLILHAAVTSIASNFSDVPSGGSNVVFNNSGSGTANYPGTTQSVGLPSLAPGGANLPGSGSFTIDAQVLFANSNYFPDAAGRLSLVIPSGNLRDQFTTIPPSAEFIVGSTFGGGATSTVTPTPGNVNGQPVVFGGTGTDFLFQVDASAGFSVVPEPSTFILLSLGAVLLLGVCSIRRMRAVNVAQQG